MAAAVGQGQAAPVQPAATRTDMAPVLQQLNLASLRTRTNDLHNAISRILHSFHTLPSLKWSEVLGQFAMVNVELLNLVEDIKPILRMFVVYPKNVTAEKSTILPIMLSSKLLPELESEEAALKDQMLAGIANLPVHMQIDKIQKQIDLVRSVCETAEKVLGDARKAYGLSSRQGPVALTTLDKAQAARIAEQEKLLRAASNHGEGLRVSPDQQGPPMLPPHLASALGTSATDTSSSFQRNASALPPSGLIRPVAPQQQTSPAQILQRSSIGAPMQSLAGASPLTGVGAAAATIPYVNSPTSRTGNFNVPSPQQHQHQVQQQQNANLLRQQKMQQLQKAQQQQAQQQQAMQAQVLNQQLRRPGTPPIPQGQGTVQPQGPQQHMLQLQQHQVKLQQNQLQQQLQQHQLQQHYQDKHSLQQLQAQQQHQQHQQHQQTLQQQLQNPQLQAAQNVLSQGNQGRNTLTQLAGMNPLYGNTQSALLPSNMMGNLTQPGQNSALLQRQYGSPSQMYNMGNNMGNNMASNMGNTIGNTMGNMGLAGTGAQATSTLALPLQQQLAGQANFGSLFNANQTNAFGQQRQQPPPQ